MLRRILHAELPITSVLGVYHNLDLPKEAWERDQNNHLRRVLERPQREPNHQNKQNHCKKNRNHTKTSQEILQNHTPKTNKTYQQKQKIQTLGIQLPSEKLFNLLKTHQTTFLVSVFGSLGKRIKRNSKLSKTSRLSHSIRDSERHLQLSESASVVPAEWAAETKAKRVSRQNTSWHLGGLKRHQSNKPLT